jgi:hypothetical protein
VLNLVRYVAADARQGQRWLAPVLVFLAAELPFNVGGGSAFSVWAFSTALLFAIAIWLTVTVLSTMDPAQVAVLVVAAGSFRVRLAGLACAYAAVVGLAAFAVVWPLVVQHPTTRAGVAAAIVAHLLTGLGGVAFGALLARPVLARRAWSVLAGVLVVVAEVVVPHAPPARQILELLDRDHPGRFTAPLAATAVQTVLLAAVVVAAAQRIARPRE